MRVPALLDERREVGLADALVLACVAEFDDGDLSALDALVDPIDSDAEDLGDVRDLQ